LFLVVVLVACQPCTLKTPQDTSSFTETPCEGTVPSGCTVFTISKGEQVFFGGNDDYINPDS
jgi:hypothetical protein